MTLDKIKKTLREYMAIPRLSGYEKEMAYRLRDDLKKYTDEVRIDKIGEDERLITIGEDAPC